MKKSIIAAVCVLGVAGTAAAVSAAPAAIVSNGWTPMATAS